MSYIVLYLLELYFFCFVSVSPLLVVIDQSLLQFAHSFLVFLVLVW